MPFAIIIFPHGMMTVVLVSLYLSTNPVVIQAVILLRQEFLTTLTYSSISLIHMLTNTKATLSYKTNLTNTVTSFKFRVLLRNTGYLVLLFL